MIVIMITMMIMMMMIVIVITVMMMMIMMIVIMITIMMMMMMMIMIDVQYSILICSYHIVCAFISIAHIGRAMEPRAKIIVLFGSLKHWMFSHFCTLHVISAQKLGFLPILKQWLRLGLMLKTRPSKRNQVMGWRSL